MNTPLVSVIIAAYNAEKWIRRCLDSVLSQTYGNIEVIVVDDASTDNTLGILRRYADRDSRVMVLSMEKNCGAPTARNRAKRIARGDFLTTVDADDKIAPDTIELSVSEMLKDPEIDKVVYKLIMVNAETNEETPFRVNPQREHGSMTGEEACYWSVQWDIPGLGMTRSPLEQSLEEEAEFGQYGDETNTHLNFYRARKVKLGEGRYYYYQNPESYTREVSVKRFEILECRISLRKHLADLGAGEKIIRRLDVSRWRELIATCYFYWRHKKTFTEKQKKDIMKRLAATYDTFHFRDLPLKIALRPRFAMMPTFGLFYKQLSLVFSLGLIRVR